MNTRTIRALGATIALATLLVPGPGLAQGATPGTATATIDPAAFGPTVTNPFFPLASVGVKIFEGDFVDEETGNTVHERVEERVLPQTASVAGVDVTVVEVHEYADGELTERTLDYYAQHEDGTVFYFGEDVDMYENDELVSHDGAWRAGEGENLPGVFMPPAPAVGVSFEQERAPGIAEDRSTVIAVDQDVTVAAGTFAGCIRTEDVNPLDDATEFKLYCPGVGVVHEENDEGAMELIAFAGGQRDAPAVATPDD